MAQTLLRSRPVLRLACILLAGLVAVASSAQAAERRFALGVQDRLRVHVYEWPALTGEFTIGPDGFLSLPLIGEVSAAGVSISDLTRAISERLKAKAQLAELPDVAVDVLQYRPFYILGRVERSGEYAYRPGMMVLNAVSIAGGIYRRQQISDWAAERDAIQSTGDGDVLATRLQELAAREARLRAEIQQRDQMPPFPGDGSAAARRFEADERAIFKARKEQFDNGLKVLADRVKLYQDEIKSLEAQGVAERRERVIILRELNDVKDLVARALTPAPRLVPLERGVAQIDREIQINETSMIRARQQINMSEQLIATLRDERLTAATNEMKTTQSMIVETQERLRMSRRIVIGSEAAVLNEESKATQDAMSSLMFQITRATDGVTVTIEAAETTEVLPGDIVNVLRRDAPAVAASDVAAGPGQLSADASASPGPELIR